MKRRLFEYTCLKGLAGTWRKLKIWSLLDVRTDLIHGSWFHHGVHLTARFALRGLTFIFVNDSSSSGVNFKGSFWYLSIRYGNFIFTVASRLTVSGAELMKFFNYWWTISSSCIVNRRTYLTRLLFLEWLIFRFFWFFCLLFRLIAYSFFAALLRQILFFFIVLISWRSAGFIVMNICYFFMMFYHDLYIFF